jgi:hypothetical protein
MSDEEEETREQYEERREAHEGRPALNLPPGLHLDVADVDYHADPSAGISLSSSVACEMLRSARHAWRMHPKLGGKAAPAPTKAMDGGSLLHMMLLGRGPKLRLVEAKDWRTKAAKAEQEAGRAAGELPVLAHKFEAMTTTVVEIHTELRRRGIDLTRGAPEATLIWEEDGVLCRARADLWAEEIATIYDVKFLSDASPEAVARHMMNFGVDVQAAHYTAGFETAFPALAGRVAFKLVVIEQETGEILIAHSAGSMKQLGEWKRGVALERWKRCLAEDRWLGYNDDQEAAIEAPEYATREILEGGSKGVSF